MASTMAALCNQTIVASSLSALPHTSNCNSLRQSVKFAPLRQRNAGVMCKAENDPIGAAKDLVSGTKNTITEESVRKNMEQNESEKQSVFGTKPVSGSFYPRPENERRPELGNKNFGSIMAFDGPGPETMNGRLAMLGFVWAFFAEKLSGKPIFEQVFEPGSPGLFWLIVATNLTIFATLVPIFNGESPDSRSNGPFTARAERWNGRIAMVGFAGLLAFEYFTGRGFFA